MNYGLVCHFLSYEDFLAVQLITGLLDFSVVKVPRYFHNVSSSLQSQNNNLLTCTVPDSNAFKDSSSMYIMIWWLHIIMWFTYSTLSHYTRVKITAMVFNLILCMFRPRLTLKDLTFLLRDILWYQTSELIHRLSSFWLLHTQNTGKDSSECAGEL